MIIGYTTGVFDLFHIGHLNIIQRSKALCDFLIVGISTDELVFKEKKHYPIISFSDRCSIVQSIKYVDKIVPQVNKNKLEAWQKLKFNKMFVGSDWKGTDAWKQYEIDFKDKHVDIIYLDHTDGISSSILKEKLNLIY